MTLRYVKMVFRILIVGGGIAGLASAIGLRGPDREIVVVEQSRLNKEIGALISLQPNASKIVAKWGLAPCLERTGAMVDKGFRIYTTDGTLQKEILFDPKDYDGDRVVYHRMDLHEILKEAAVSADRSGPPVRIRTSGRVVNCDCEEGIITLENGETLKGDLIIGADGMYLPLSQRCHLLGSHSVIREHVLETPQKPIPTGLSAYRMLIPTERLTCIPELAEIMDPTDSFTTMIMGYNCRIVMGPARNGKVYGITGLVPDESMNEDSSKSSWTSEGSMDKLLKSYDAFPQYVKSMFGAAPNLGLWQLRDLDPLPTWVKGRAIIIGDASHAMLPTQGQGASQSVEDAEALGAFFEDIIGHEIDARQINERLQVVFKCRHARASLIQAYSRQQAKPATSGETKVITLYNSEMAMVLISRDTAQFLSYNCNYNGAKEWQQRQMDGLVH